MYPNRACPAVPPSGEGVLRNLKEMSVRTSGVPELVAEQACAAVRSNIGWDVGNPQASKARVEAYFWAVVRGKALRSRDGGLASLKSRFVLATIVEDMRSQGMSRDAVRAEVLTQHHDLLTSAGVSENQLDVAC